MKVCLFLFFILLYKYIITFKSTNKKAKENFFDTFIFNYFSKSIIVGFCIIFLNTSLELFELLNTLCLIHSILPENIQEHDLLIFTNK